MGSASGLGKVSRAHAVVLSVVLAAFLGLVLLPTPAAQAQEQTLSNGWSEYLSVAFNDDYNTMLLQRADERMSTFWTARRRPGLEMTTGRKGCSGER